ncbi:integrase [Deinococcus enclensis]|uniref:Integrase n=1 Tax=Deinococcus enclensis TaxID=1049582 RepID=A0ABT9MIE5_9DEIO|nr:integrase [Deinococcus enclensis]
MHAQGGNLTSISAHLGHAQVSTTLNIYRSVFDSERRGVTLNLSAKPKAQEQEQAPQEDA